MSQADVVSRGFDGSDYRGRHLRDQESSGLSVAEYCRCHDLCAATFYNWRKQGRQWAQHRLVTFTEVGRTVATAQSDWAVEIVVASGAIVRVRDGADPGLLRTLLEALA